MSKGGQRKQMKTMDVIKRRRRSKANCGQWGMLMNTARVKVGMQVSTKKELFQLTYLRRFT